MLLVDERIGSADLWEPLQRLGLPASVSRLDFGDVAFMGRGEGGREVMVGIELKGIRDLISSLRTKRLQGYQLPGLQRTYDHRWLIVEGKYRIDRRGYLLVSNRRGWHPVHGRMTSGELEKQLLTIEMQGGVHVRHTGSRRDTLRFLTGLYHWWTDVDLDAHKSHLVIYNPPAIVPISQFRQTAITWPGIGFKTSKLAEEQFGSIESAVLATEDEWMQIEGIGRTTAARIVRAIKEER